jgi:hypothetical protein
MSGALQGSLEKASRGSRIPRRRKPKVNRGAHRMDCPIKIGAGAGHRNVGFVYPPAAISRFQFPTAPLVEFRREPLPPTQNAWMIGSQTSPAHPSLDILIRKGISQIPTDRTKNDYRFELSPFG